MNFRVVKVRFFTLKVGEEVPDNEMPEIKEDFAEKKIS